MNLQNKYSFLFSLFNMSSVDATDVYYPISWVKTSIDLILSFFSSPQKTKRSLPEEAECGSIEGIKCWLREGIFT